INAAQTDEEATLDLYGSATHLHPRRFTVSVAAACRNQGKIDARAGFGVYWGKDSCHNTAYRIGGKQLDGRALLTGILYALAFVDPTRALDIFTSSKAAIRAICYKAGQNHTRGWDCANGDLLERITEFIRARQAQVSFFHVNLPRKNTGNVAARGLA
ncbi:hypothetical protein C8R46DRAFT_820117, partial [Mycena filopes]